MEDVDEDTSVFLTFLKKHGLTIIYTFGNKPAEGHGCLFEIVCFEKPC